MQCWISKVHTDEDTPSAEEGKYIMIRGSKDEINELSNFLNHVSEYLKTNDYCHMHFRDYLNNWDKNNLDLEINVDNR